jgi:hypothetical protein
MTSPAMTIQYEQMAFTWEHWPLQEPAYGGVAYASARRLRGGA